MATTYTDATMGARAIGARTDSVGAGVTDVNAEEDRYAQNHIGEGKLSADSFEPVAGAAATMNVVIGSGSAKADYYVVAGNIAGQGNYIVRQAAATETVALNAADGSLARIDEIYLVVLDDAYDSTGLALPRFAYRDGTPSGSPVAPGADGSWDAYVLLARIDVPAAAADILSCTITDLRAWATFTAAGLQVLQNAAVAGNLAVTGTINGITVGSGLVDGVDVSAHDHGAAGGVAVDAGDLTGLKTAVDAANVDADTLDGDHASAFAGASHVGAGGSAHADATTGSDGFMTAADKAKLDGIESGAEANKSVLAGSGISVSGDGNESNATVSHADTSTASSKGPLARGLKISRVAVDTYGHVTLLETDDAPYAYQSYASSPAIVLSTTESNELSINISGLSSSRAYWVHAVATMTASDVSNGGYIGIRATVDGDESYLSQQGNAHTTAVPCSVSANVVRLVAGATSFSAHMKGVKGVSGTVGGTITGQLTIVVQEYV